MIHNISRFIAALALILLTAQTAGAQTVSNVPYIDADGNEQTATYATVVTSDMGGTSADNFNSGNGWYYVNSDVTLSGAYNTSTTTQNIILGDGATLTVSGLLRFQNASLNIYCQSGGTGRLVVSGSYGSNAIFSVTSGGTLTINGGTVEVTNTSNNGNGFNGNLVMNGGTATFTSKKGVTCYAITGSVTLNGGTFTATSGSWKGVCDKTVTIGDGKYFKDGSGNIYYGTLTDAQNNALNGVTLSPATKTEYIQACLGTGNDGSASKPYTISDAAGWDAFCLALQDNDTYNRFSGKTVQLGADITVTRMAGSTGHEFTGTFDGGGHTLTVNITGTVQGTAPFCEIKGATIRNLVVTGNVAGKRHSAGLVGFARGDDASVENTIENCLVATDVSIMGDDNGYLGGIVGHGLKCKLTIRGCAFTGSLTSESNYTGGLQGWSDGNTLILEDDIFAASRVSAANVGFHPIAFHNNNKTTTATVSNVYYTIAPTCTTSTRIAAAGKQARTVTAGTDVTIGAIALTGTATQYTVSGITAYSGGGLQLGQTLYYGSDDQLSLTLTTSAQCDQPGYQYTYTASAGTLIGNTLTMPDQDVTISVALAPIDWATVNKGNSADPYMIYNKDQLLLLAHRVNGTNDETANMYYGKFFKLGADITFDPNDLTLDEGQSNYEAIGGNMRYFNGVFDGANHTVSGIRIRKDGSDNADSYQGLFGFIDGAQIHDVHLTDARITGRQNVGGIAGYINAGSISGCTITDSYITSTYGNYGTICGFTKSYSSLTNNYYHDCTVNGTAVTSGVGCNGADITANNGALPAYAITLGANITTPPGTFAGQTGWLATPPVGARLAPENGFTLAGNHYFASDYVFTPGSTLASGAAQGYTPRATLGDVLLDLYTPTGDTDLLAGKAIARLTITADCDGKTLASTEAIYSTGQPVTVAYIKADGNPGEASAIALDGHETLGEDGRVSLAAGTYYVGTDIAYATQILPAGDVTLILANGKTMTLYGNTTGIDGYNLTIYGQSLDDATAGTLRYDGKSLGIYVSNYEQHSGNVSITTTGSVVSGIYADVTLRGGTLTISADGNNAYAIYGNTHSILGGRLTATATGTDATGIDAYAESGTAITLGWTRPDDRITASSISTEGGTVAVADGQALTDGSGHIYTGTLTASVLSGFAAETTLQPCLALADAADNTAAITDHAGQTLAVALSGRTLYKDGSWNTLCLPFAVDLTASGTLSGDNVQAMTLNTTTSNFADGTLTLNFTAAETIPAGTPFIIKWDNTGVNIENPVFEDVTISNATNDATVAGVLTVTGTYAPVRITDATGDNTKLYLGAANKLYYPTKSMTIGTHRAYFQLLGDLTAGEPTSPQSSHVRAFNLNFGNDETTGIISVHDSGFTVNGSAAWYTLDGRRLDGQPTAKGLYIHGGRKVIVK